MFNISMDSIMQNLATTCSAITDGAAGMKPADRLSIIFQFENVLSRLTRPEEKVTTHLFCNLHILSAYLYLLGYKIAITIPDEGITYTELAEKTDINHASELRQMLAPLVADRVFVEREPNRVAHTPISQTLQQPGVRDFHQCIVKYCLAMVLAQPVVIRKYGHGWVHAHETAFTEVFGRDPKQTKYQCLEEDAELGGSFKKMMAYLSDTDAMSNRPLIQSGFPWSGVHSIIDIGGGHGKAAFEVVRACPHIKATVQDQAHVITQAREISSRDLPKELRDRVTFEARDFFAPQLVGADVYFLRLILHNHSDVVAMKILASVASAITEKARILIMDYVLWDAAPKDVPRADQPAEVETWADRMMPSAMSGQMKLCLNACERYFHEWRNLLKAECRLQIKNVFRPAASALSLIEIGLADTAT